MESHIIQTAENDQLADSSSQNSWIYSELKDPNVQKHKLGTYMASLAILSTIVGGGIVGIPFSIYQTGIPLGILMNILIAGSVYYSCVLYLAGKDLMPVVVNSHYETGYLTIGKASIYMICLINLVGGFGLMMIYFIVFGETTASIVHQLFYPSTTNFLTTRACYVLILGLSLAYPVSKK